MAEEAEYKIGFDEESSKRSGEAAGDAFAEAAERGGVNAELSQVLRGLTAELRDFRSTFRDASRGADPSSRSQPSPGRSGSRGGSRGGGGQTLFEKEEAAKDRWSDKKLREEWKAMPPGERLGVLKDELASAEKGSVDQARLRYEVAVEQNRIDRTAEREKARAARAAEREAARAKKAEEREASREQKTTEKAWRDQEKQQKKDFAAQEKAKARAEADDATHAGRMRAENLRGMSSAERLAFLQAEVDNATPGSAEHRRAELGLAREQTNRKLRPPKPPPLPDPGVSVAGALGSALSSRAFAGLASGGSQAARGALFGDASSAMKGGIGAATGIASLAAGPYAPVVEALGQAVQGIVSMLDGLVDNLGKYNGRVLAAKAQLTVDEFKYRKEMADATADLQVEWIDLKRDAIGLMRDLRPEIQVVIDAIRGMVSVIRFFTGGFKQVNQATNGGLASNMLSGVVPGAGLLSAWYRGKSAGTAAPTAGGGTAAGESGGGWGSTLAGLVGSIVPGGNLLSAAVGGGGTGAPATAPQPVAPAMTPAPEWSGVSFSNSNTFNFTAQDRESMERGAEQVRRRLMAAYGHLGDRVEAMAAMHDGRNAVALMG